MYQKGKDKINDDMDLFNLIDGYKQMKFLHDARLKHNDLVNDNILNTRPYIIDFDTEESGAETHGETEFVPREFDNETVEVVSSILRKKIRKDQTVEESVEREVDMDAVRNWMAKYKKRQARNLKKHVFD
jgi:hypothetical protein